MCFCSFLSQYNTYLDCVSGGAIQNCETDNPGSRTLVREYHKRLLSKQAEFYQCTSKTFIYIGEMASHMFVLLERSYL